jgi:hypothetical protein
VSLPLSLCLSVRRIQLGEGATLRERGRRFQSAFRNFWYAGSAGDTASRVTAEVVTPRNRATVLPGAISASGEAATFLQRSSSCPRTYVPLASPRIVRTRSCCCQVPVIPFAVSQERL